MMPKSILSGAKLAQIEADNTIELPTWEYQFDISNTISKINIKALLHAQCNINNAKLNRQLELIRYVKSFKKRFDNGISHSSLYDNYQKFRAYLIWCDNHKIDAFIEVTWRKYHDYLWKQVLVFQPPRPRWMYKCGEKIGLSETTANLMFKIVGQSLIWCEAKVFSWEKQLRPFRSGYIYSHKAYSEDELKIVLKRLSSYFFQLTLPLLKDSLPKSINVCIEGESFIVPVTSSNKKGRAKNSLILMDSAFNQAMSCGYYLLSFFTAFNTSQLLNLHHPIELEKNKTSEFYKLKAYKHRANREVMAYVGGHIHKKSLEFIETLQALSLKYRQTNSGSLLYLIDKNGEPEMLTLASIQHANLENRLLLLSEQPQILIPYMISLHSDFMKTYLKGYIEFDHIKIKDRVVKRTKKIVRRFFAKRITSLNFALLQLIINSHPNNEGKYISLKYAVSPLQVLQDNKDLFIRMSYEDKRVVEFYVDIKYLDFIHNIQNFSASRYKENALKTHYLLPFGAVNKTNQWDGYSPDLSNLKSYGILSGDLLVNLTASRFRETAAKIARRKKGRTNLEVSQILNNQYQTTIKHYNEGNNYDNQLIVSQALRVIENISGGLTIAESKDKVKQELNIEVLRFDQLHNSDVSLTGIGTGCSDKLQKQKVSTSENIKLPCFNYENCIKCSYAKLIEGVEPLYRLLSFIECMEESWLYYPQRYSKNIGAIINQYKSVIEKSLSSETIKKAKYKLDTEGRHPLWNNLGLVSLGFKGI